MDKNKAKKKSPDSKSNVVSELNNSLYCLAAYLSEFATVLRESAPKSGVR
jgi:hypothetical protein